jgi:hypothetical protein
MPAAGRHYRIAGVVSPPCNTGINAFGNRQGCCGVLS